MSERRESIKKSLGISEYPWSSEDEEEPSTHIESPPALAQAPNNSVTDALSMMQSLTRRQLSSSQQTPSNSTPNSAVSQSGILLTPTQAAGRSAAGPCLNKTLAPANARKAQATREDRALFWSMLCDPDRPNMNIMSRPRHMRVRSPRPVGEAHRRDVVTSRGAGHPRRPDAPAPAQRVSPLREIRGILAIEKATARNFKHHRPNRANFSCSPLFVRQELEAAASQAVPPKNRVFPTNGEGIDDWPANCVRRAFYSRVNRPPCQATTSSSGLGGASEPQPGTSRQPPPLAPTPPRDDSSDVESASPIKKEDGDQSGRIAPAGDSPACAAISLEEEVLEVEPAVEATEVAVDAVDGLPNEEPQQSTSAPDAETANGEPRGVKRKKEEKEETAKELNQSLLRLLECPVCLEWILPPMSQCRRGHLVCFGCRARLSACPVCRTAFSSVRNRAMEGVAELLRFPCRHGCSREVPLKRRAAHDESCSRRRHACPAPACVQRPPLALRELAAHFQSKHPTMLRTGCEHKFTVKMNTEQHDTWLVQALHALFHLRIDVDIRTWGITIYTAYIGPKNNAKTFTYEVTIVGNHNSRKLVYSRATHSDLESASLNFSRQDCFHLSLDQALNFLRQKNRDAEGDNPLTINVALSKNEVEVEQDDSGDV